MMSPSCSCVELHGFIGAARSQEVGLYRGGSKCCSSAVKWPGTCTSRRLAEEKFVLSDVS